MRQRRPALGLLLVAAVALGGCGAVGGDVPFVNLAERHALPEAASTEIEPIRMAVAAVLSPEGNIDNYSGLARYLGERLGRPVELVQRRTYAEVNDLVAAGSVDLAFVCTSAYVSGSGQGTMDLLVVPEIDAARVYYSSVIVPAGSTVDTVADLKGEIFAFTDPMSHTGRVYPTYLVQQLGEDPESFFSASFFAYSHDRAIEAVAGGVAAGAAVDSLVLDHAIARDPSLQQRVNVIHRSPPFGIPPVVVPSGLSDDFRRQLEHALLDLQHDSEGRAILTELGVDKFVIGDDADYDGARVVVEATGIDS